MNDNSKRVSSLTLKRVIAITVILLTLVLTINMGVVARALAFPFLYVFGLGTYFIFILIYVFAIAFIIRGSWLKIRFKTILILFLGYVGIITLISLIYAGARGYTLILGPTESISRVNFVEYYNNIIASIGGSKGYFYAGFINMFGETFVSGGFIGNFFAAALMGSIGLAGGIVIASVIIAVALGIIFVPKIINKIQHREPHKEKETNVDEIENFDVISTASLNNQDNIETYQDNEVSLNNEAILINNDSPFSPRHIVTNEFSNQTGVFTKKKFLPSEEKVSPVSFTKEETHYEQESIFNPNENEVSNNKNETPNNENVIPNNETTATQTPPITEPTQDNFYHPPVKEEKPIVKEKEKVPETPTPKKRPKIKWIPPSIDLLDETKNDGNNEVNEECSKVRLENINNTFQAYGVKAKAVEYIIGPSVTRFLIQVELGERVLSIEKLLPEIQLALEGVVVTFAQRVPGTTYSAFDVENKKANRVSFKDVVSQLPSYKTNPHDIGFGLDINGKCRYANFVEFPHCLLAGSSGSGKSVYLSSIITTLMMRGSPEETQIIIVDPKVVDSKVYENGPHLMCPIIHTTEEAVVMLKKLYDEMSYRYNVLGEKGVSKLAEYNELAKNEGFDTMPFIFVFIDEYADLVRENKELNPAVSAIAAKGRAAGIHMLLATQRPSTDVMTGVIKTNFTTRIALLAASQSDSVLMIGEKGAESLLGNGDALIMSTLISRTDNVRVQGGFISRPDTMRVMSYLKEHYQTFYDERFLDLSPIKEVSQDEAKVAYQESKAQDDEAKYQSIKSWVMSNEYMSMSKIQVNCGVGFSRAGKTLVRLQKEGIVSTVKEASNLGYKVLKTDAFIGANPGEESVPDSGDYVEDL